MEETVWVVEVPLDGASGWHSLCRCRSPESVAEIVRALAKTDENGPTVIKVTRIKVLAYERGVK